MDVKAYSKKKSRYILEQEQYEPHCTSVVMCMASGVSETMMDDNSLVWNVVYQVTGIFPLGFLGMESESIGTQGPGASTPHAHPVLVALLGVGEHPGLLWAVKGPHLRRTNQP